MLKFEIGCGKYFVAPPRTKRKLEAEMNFLPLVDEKDEKEKDWKKDKKEKKEEKKVKCTEQLQQTLILTSLGGKPTLGSESKLLASTEKKKKKLTDWTPTPKSRWLEQKIEADIREFFSREKLPLLSTNKHALQFNLEECPRYYSFERQDPDGKLGLLAKRQRTPWWFDERKNSMTGSKIVKALNFFDIDSMEKTWYETYDPDNPVYLDMLAYDAENEQQAAKEAECMEWGTHNEPNALATLIYHLGVKYDLEFYETTLTPIPITGEQRFLMEIIKKTLKTEFNYDWVEGDEKIWAKFAKSTPDISGKECRTGILFASELKCAYGLRLPKVYNEIPYYYYLQLQFHMLTNPKIEYGHLVSWSPKTTRIWRVEKDLQACKMALPALVFFHKMGLDKTPPSSTIDDKLIKKIKDYCREQVENAIFLGEFPSVYASKSRGTEEKV